MCLLTQSEVFGLWFCVACRDPGDCLSGELVLSLPLFFSKDFQSGMVSDGFQTQRRGSWIPGKERARRVLASAVSNDGRKEWMCTCCSESKMWTRWRCRRCYHDIPAGVAWEVQAGDCCNSRMRPRVARSWMSKRASFRRSCEISRSFSCVPKEFRENLKSNVQQQLQEVEQRRHDLMPEHQKVQKRSQKNASRTEEEICRKTVPEQKWRCGSCKRSLSKRRSVPFFYRT